MITITANARRATFKSDDLITSGSVGIDDVPMRWRAAVQEMLDNDPE